MQRFSCPWQRRLELVAAFADFQPDMDFHFAFRAFLFPRGLGGFFLFHLRLPLFFLGKLLLPWQVSLDDGALGMNAITRVGCLAADRACSTAALRCRRRRVVVHEVACLEVANRKCNRLRNVVRRIGSASELAGHDSLRGEQCKKTVAVESETQRPKVQRNSVAPGHRMSKLNDWAAKAWTAKPAHLAA